MSENIIKERSLLERFSSSLLARGKKSSGNKILLKSLFFLRQNTDKSLLNLARQRDKTKNEGSKSLLQKNFVNNSKKVVDSKIEREEKKEKEKTVKDKLFLKQTKKKDLQSKKLTPKISVESYTENTENFELESKPLSDFLNKSICKICVDNTKPILETRKIRKGRVTYRVPLVTQAKRQEGKAVSFLIESATLKKKGTPLSFQNWIETTSLNGSDFDLQNESIQSRSVQKKNTLVSNDFQKRITKDLLTFSSKKEFSLDLSLKRLNFYSIKHTLSEEFFDSFFAKGESVNKKKQLHTLALENRAYTHYRWW